MKKILSFICVFFFVFGLMINTADAKRFGGGRSFGMQRSASNFSHSFSSPNRQTSPASGMMSKLAGPLAGLALGGLLASLFMGHGVMSGILSWLLVGGVILLLLSFLRGRFTSPSQAFAQPVQLMQYQNQFAPVTTNSHRTVGFDEIDFLREAKVQFMRLQAAYDSKNLSDLREFTAPEVFAEIQMQLQERNDQPNQTEVISLDSKLLDVSTESDRTITSVEFSGAIREELNGPVQPFNEIWHFQKLHAQQKWVVAGLQQNPEP